MSEKNYADLDLNLLLDQIKSSSPKFDKFKERAAGSRYQSFRVQVVEKIGKIQKLDRDRQKYLADIAEYLVHLEKMGFKYEDGGIKKPVISGSAVKKQKPKKVVENEPDDLPDDNHELTDAELDE